MKGQPALLEFTAFLVIVTGDGQKYNKLYICVWKEEAFMGRGEGGSGYLWRRETGTSSG